jgi:hypothetical protein
MRLRFLSAQTAAVNERTMSQSAIAGKPPGKEPLPPSAFWKDSILESCLIGVTNRGQSG